MDWTCKPLHCLLIVYALVLNVGSFQWLVLVLVPALIGYGLGYCSKHLFGQNRILGRVRIRDLSPTGRRKRQAPSGAGAPVFVPILG